MIFIRSPLQGLFAIYVITSSLSCAHDNNVNSCSAGNTKISLLCVNFNDIDRGGASAVRYTAAKLEQDFNWNMLGYTSGNGGNNYFGPLGARGTLQADSVWIVPDPAGNTGRGNVLRSTHQPYAWGSNPNGTNSGFSWRADFEPQKEVYFAYDMFIPAGNFTPLQQKLPGLIAGTTLEASHPGDAPPSPDDPWRGVSTLTASLQAESGHGGTGGVNGHSALNVYRYDALSVQQVDWLNNNDPTSESTDGQYLIPQGQWITVEEHIKLNTTDSNTAYNSNVDRADGIAEVWINGVLKLRKTDVTWMKWNGQGIDGMWMYTIYGGNGSDPRNIPPTVQYTYFDNFIVSTSPITH